MARYADLLGRVLDHLGIGAAVLAGHSMGGRLVTELAASQPERAIAVVLLDAIVGDTWDRMVNLFRVFPPLLVGIGTTLVVDTITTVPFFRDPKQALKLGRLVGPVIAGHARRRGDCSGRWRRSCAAGAPAGCSTSSATSGSPCSSSTATEM